VRSAVFFGLAEWAGAATPISPRWFTTTTRAILLPAAALRIHCSDQFAGAFAWIGAFTEVKREAGKSPALPPQL